jgi:hypothetical protein
LETDTLSSTKKSDLRWGPGDDEVINWKILADGEHITEDPLDVPNSVDYVSAGEDNELSDDTADLNDLFFEQFFHQLSDMRRLSMSSMLIIDPPFILQ